MLAFPSPMTSLREKNDGAKLAVMMYCAYPLLSGWTNIASLLALLSANEMVNILSGSGISLMVSVATEASSVSADELTLAEADALDPLVSAERGLFTVADVEDLSGVCCVYPHPAIMEVSTRGKIMVSFFLKVTVPF